MTLSLEIVVPGPKADFIFAAISPCFAKISAARSRQPFIPASSAPARNQPTEIGEEHYIKGMS